MSNKDMDKIEHFIFSRPHREVIMVLDMFEESVGQLSYFDNDYRTSFLPNFVAGKEYLILMHNTNSSAVTEDLLPLVVKRLYLALKYGVELANNSEFPDNNIFKRDVKECAANFGFASE